MRRLFFHLKNNQKNFCTSHFKNKIPTLNAWSYLKYGSDHFNKFPSVLIISLYLIVTKYGTTIALMEGGQYINWHEAEHANFVY